MPTSFRQELGRSVAGDSLSWLVNLGWAYAVPQITWLPIPATVIGQLGFRAYEHLHRRSPRNFTAWKHLLEDLPHLYHADWPQAVKLQFEGQLRLLPQILIADASAGPLQLQLRYRSDRFDLSGPVRELVFEPQQRLIRYLQRRNAYIHKTRKESMCLSVRNCTRSDNTLILDVRPLSYDDVLATHYALDVDWMGRTSLRTFLLNGTPGTLGPLKESLLPNILGIDVLLFTPSGSLILQKRSRQVAIRAGEFCASSSGGAAPEDITHAGKLQILREGAEELAIDPVKIKTASIRFLGLARDLVSHGVVESYFCADTLETDAEIIEKARSAPDRREHSRVFFFHLGDDLVHGSLRDDVRHARFVRKMDELIHLYGKHFSAPLFSALALWQKQRFSE